MLTAGQSIGKNGGRLEVHDRNSRRIYSIPLDDVESIVVAAKTQISSDIIQLLLLKNIPITYLDKRGNVLGYTQSNQQSLDKLIMQQKCFNDMTLRLQLIKFVLKEKILAQQRILSSYARTMNKAELKKIANKIKIYEHKVDSINVPDKLRGLEGISSKEYFDGFSHIIDSKQWDWNGRNRRPPEDPINSLLSFGYTFLEKEVRTGLVGANMDVRIGFLHSNNGRKDSLVYDIMEMFRQKVIDKFTLKLVNQHILLPIDFSYDEELGCRLSDIARRKWIINYESFVTQERKMLNGLSWRKYILKKIEAFAGMVWSMHLEDNFCGG